MQKPVKKLTSWSFSRYGDWSQCPLKAKLKHIDKMKEPPNPAMERGALIHGMAERYIKGGLKRFPAELAKFKKMINELKARAKKKLRAPIVEDSWAFKKDWTDTTWDDWAFCWLRVKVDVACEEDGEVLVVTDWKTGKFRPDQNAGYLEQLELYALAGMLKLPHIKEVRPRLVYLDEGSIFPKEDSAIVYRREDIPHLKQAWEKRVKPMLADGLFAPKPNRFCAWCHYRASNKANGGGQCKF